PGQVPRALAGHPGVTDRAGSGLSRREDTGPGRADFAEFVAVEKGNRPRIGLGRSRGEGIQFAVGLSWVAGTSKRTKAIRIVDDPPRSTVPRRVFPTRSFDFRPGGPLRPDGDLLRIRAGGGQFRGERAFAVPRPPNPAARVSQPWFAKSIVTPIGSSRSSGARSRPTCGNTSRTAR